MSIFDVLALVGGLALFLFGMHLLGEGLSNASGGKLEKILERLTSNPIKAVLLGTGVTAVIQSSSATTVMVVGFVNSGVMKLEQAVGIIMGANIGTTATSWILSLAGIQSDNIFIELLKPTSFAPVLAIIGVVMIAFMRKDRTHEIGKILLGFAILMMGMENMSAAVAPLADMPSFTNILTTFSNPLLGMLAGMIFTAIIQSSSASVGILQALSMTGVVPYATVLPIIMGQNIGTCVTALLSCIGTSKNAKRAAFVHLYFNIIGTILFMTVFYTINAFIPFGFLGQMATVYGIAIIHSTFNIVTTAILLPNRKILVKLACLTVRDTEADKAAASEFALLDDIFLDKPGLALEHSTQVTCQMAELSREALHMSVEQLWQYSEANAQKIDEIERRVDKYEDKLDTYLMKVSSSDLTTRESDTLTLLLHTIGNFERISDHACNIQDSAKEKFVKQEVFTERTDREMKIFAAALHEITDAAFDAFEKEDLGLANNVEPLEEVMDDLSMTIKGRHIDRLTTGDCTVDMSFIITDLMTNFERVADHCSNIAVAVIRTRANGFDTHKYLNMVKRVDNEQFRSQFEAFQKKYALPAAK